MADYEQIMQAARSALAAGDQAAGKRLLAMAANAQRGEDVVARTEGGGRVVRQRDGSLAFTSPGYSTTDQDAIAQIMEGATPADVVQGSVDRQRIAANPVAAHLNEFVRGVPLVGSRTDEFVDALGRTPERSQTGDWFVDGVVNQPIVPALQGAGDNMRAMTGAMQRQHPGRTTALNVGGALAAAVPAAIAASPGLAAVAPATRGGQALAAAGGGAVAGGVEGAIYGSGEGQGRERLENAWDQGRVGAALGGAVGALAPYAAQAARWAGQNIKRGVNANREAQAALGASPAAARVIRNALDQTEGQAAEAAIARGGEDAMLADAGRSTQALLDTAAQMPGDAGAVARGAVSERVQRGTNQMTEALDHYLGSPRGQQEITDEIRQQSSGARNAAYDTAYSRPIDYSSQEGRQIETFLQRVPKQAIDRANALMRLRGEESAQIMATVAEDGSVTYQRMPDVRQIDYITRAINDLAQVGDGAGALGGQTAMGSSLQGLSRGLRGVLRRAVPEYGRALDTAADAIGQRNSLDAGYDLLRSGTRREDIARALHGASEAEKAAMRQGVRSFIDDVTANVTRTITDGDTEAREGIKILREMSSRANQTKLRMLLGQEAADDLLAEIDEATTGFELRAAIAENSKTAARQAGQGAVRDQVQGGTLRALMRGEPVNSTKALVQAITGETAEAQTLREMGLYREIADVLVNTRGPRAQAALRRIRAAEAGERLSEAQARMVAQTLVATLGAGGVPAANRELSQTLSR